MLAASLCNDLGIQLQTNRLKVLTVYGFFFFLVFSLWGISEH
jgi:hypothetical protein